MAMTPDDSVLLEGLGIVLLSDLANLLILTLLHGNDATIYPVDALTRLSSGIFIMVFSIAVHTTLFVRVYTTELRSNFRLQAPGTEISPNFCNVHSHHHQLHWSHYKLGCMDGGCYTSDSRATCEECWYGAV